MYVRVEDVKDVQRWPVKDEMPRGKESSSRYEECIVPSDQRVGYQVELFQIVASEKKKDGSASLFFFIFSSCTYSMRIPRYLMLMNGPRMSEHSLNSHGSNAFYFRAVCGYVYKILVIKMDLWCGIQRRRRRCADK